jgi:hypothetical protein
MEHDGQDHDVGDGRHQGQATDDGAGQVPRALLTCRDRSSKGI